MTPLALRQAWALVWLRATLLKRALFADRAWGRALLALFALATGGLVSFAIAAVIYDSSLALRANPDEVAARGGPLAIFATRLSMVLVARLWFAIRSLGGAGPFLDPRRFLPLAVPAKVVSGINFAAALLEPTWLFFFAPLAAVAFGTAALHGSPPAWALLAAEAATVVAVGGVLHLFGAIGSVLGARPGLQRGLFVVLGFAGFAAFQLTVARPGRPGLATMFAERRWELIALTPGGWAAVLAKAFADGNVVSMATPLLLLGASGALAVWGAHRLSLREAQRPPTAGSGLSQRAPRAGWRLPFGPPAFSALFEKELKTLLRVGWLQLVIVPAGFLVLRTALVGAQGGSFMREPLLFAAAYAHLAVLDIASNAFGRDHGASRAWFLWPVDRRLMFLAKNACAYLFSLLTFALLCAVQAFAGGVTAGHVLIALLAHAAAFPFLAAFGNAASILWPLPVRARLQRVKGAGPLGARLIALGLLLGAVWVPFWSARWTGLPLIASYGGALAVALVAYGGLLAFAVALLERRKEPMLAALARDE